MGDPDGPSLGYLNEILRETYAPALRDQLNRPGLTFALSPLLPLTRRRRAWLRFTRRPRAVKRRITETWGVLLHGLPESDW